jgi:hypothetical protein
LYSPISGKDAESIRSSIGSDANFCSSLKRVGREGFLDLTFRRDGDRGR